MPLWRNRKATAPRELSAKEIATLIAVTNVSEGEIRKWHADFLDHYPSGRLNKKTFVEYYQKLHPEIGPASSFEKIFETIDTNNDGTIEFNEIIVVMLLMSRVHNLGTKLALAFDMWDDSGDGYIDQSELVDAIRAIYDRAGVTDRKGDQDPTVRAKSIIQKLDISGDRKLTKDEFVTGCQNDTVIRNLLAPEV